jgi:YbgC/YbaW family acyl-CoA thioester hydrolase
MENQMQTPMGTQATGAFRFSTRLRVRWSEVDMQKIVFNAHYLTYLDSAMVEYWRALALPYQETLAACGGDLYLRKATLDYGASAHADDLLDIGLRCQKIGRSSLIFAAEIACAGKRLIQAELVYVFADASTQQPLAVPEHLRQALLGFEAGESMVLQQVGDWSSLGPGARQVRHEVFVLEQQIPLALEQDAADADAVHVLLCNRLSAPLATGRMLQVALGESKIGRLAVTRALRGGGLGRQVLQALISKAVERGDQLLSLHAQASAQTFYLRAGFEVSGPPFFEAGIEHTGMVKRLV